MKKHEYQKIAKTVPVYRIVPVKGKLSRECVAWRYFDAQGNPIRTGRADGADIPPDALAVKLAYYWQVSFMPFTWFKLGLIAGWLLALRFG